MAGFLINIQDKDTNLQYSNAWFEIEAIHLKPDKHVNIVGFIYNSQNDKNNGKEPIKRMRFSLSSNDVAFQNNFTNSLLTGNTKDIITSSINLCKSKLGIN